MGTVSNINQQQLDRLQISADLRKAIKAILKADPRALVFLQPDDTLLITGIHTATQKRATQKPAHVAA